MNSSSDNKFLKSEHTRLRIMEVYLDLIPDKKWDRISVKEICANANITRGTFYQYFNDIYDLLEQIEAPLLQELQDKYKTLKVTDTKALLPENFEERFDITPPKPLEYWFDFCKSHKKEMKALLSVNGDSYFIIKLKNIINEQINYMMDMDSMPHDELRLHFSKAFLELHFLSVRTWMEASEDEFLSTDEIINILNTMRIGANYLSYLNGKPK